MSPLTSSRLPAKIKPIHFGKKIKIEVSVNGLGDLDGNQGMTFYNDLMLDEKLCPVTMTGNGLKFPEMTSSPSQGPLVLVT